MLNKIFLILCVVAFTSTLNVAFETFDVEYSNTKYFRTFNVTLRRFRRNHPYNLNLYMDLVMPLGNNLKIEFSLYELIAGHYVLTPLRFVLPLCDYMNEQTIHIFPENIMKNTKCPLPAGLYISTNVSFHFDKIPNIPFTYSSLITRVAGITRGKVHEELAFQLKSISTITQKLDETKSKKKQTKANH